MLSADMTRPDLDLRTDAWFRGAIGSLWFCGVVYLLLGLFIPSFLLTLSAEDNFGPREATTLVVVFGVALACAVGNFVVAWALARRKSWAWIAAVVIGGLYAPSGCVIFGAVILYALLRGGVKDAYDAESRERSGAPAVF
jgi:ABC-type glycerol-3-phosphate transport system permease component